MTALDHARSRLSIAVYRANLRHEMGDVLSRRELADLWRICAEIARLQGRPFDHEETTP